MDYSNSVFSYIGGPQAISQIKVLVNYKKGYVMSVVIQSGCRLIQLYSIHTCCCLPCGYLHKHPSVNNIITF